MVTSKKIHRANLCCTSTLRTAVILFALFAPQAASFGGGIRKPTALSVSAMPALTTEQRTAKTSADPLPTPSTTPAAPVAADAAMIPTYDALARRCIERHAREHATLKNGQLFVGVGGGPGSGKSSLSEAVAARIDALLGRVGSAKVLPMDGFHFTRADLRAMADAEEGGSYDALLARRGAPWTFDAAGCVAAFSGVREDGFASLPVYSRAKSDPVPDGVVLDASTSVVLLEGNYLLAWDEEEWAPLRDVFDETWYVACGTMEAQRERLIGRHLETWTEEKARMWGEGREGAAAKADANDVLNAAWIDIKSRHHADLIVESK